MQDLFNKAINSRGYIVIGVNQPYPIKHQFPHLTGHIGTVYHPFTITQETTLEDAAVQSRLWCLDESNMTPYEYYYRVITD